MDQEGCSEFKRIRSDQWVLSVWLADHLWYAEAFGRGTRFKVFLEGQKLQV